MLITFLLKSAYNVADDIGKTLRSSQWPTTPGTLIRVIEESRFTRPSSKSYSLEYSYVIDGREYRGNQISFSRRHGWSKRDIDELVAQLRLEQEITVHYDPSNPTVSVLQPGGSNLANIIFFCVQIIIIGLITLFFVLSIRWAQIFDDTSDGKGKREVVKRAA